MSTETQAPKSREVRGRQSHRAEVVVCLGAAVLAAATFPLIGNTLAPVDGRSATEAFSSGAGRLQGAGLMAALASAGLFVAAARLRRALPGLSGAVAGTAGAAVALMLAIYVASFAAGSIVTEMLDAPGDGVGEAALVAANAVELARYGPSLALLVAVLMVRRQLPRPLVLSAGLLALLFLVPMTSWIATILTPVWLGVAGAVAPGDRRWERSVAGA